MKGVFNKRPLKPRYSGTWKVSLVTGLFEKWPNNSNLELKRLSRKCAMLLALTSKCDSLIYMPWIWHLCNFFRRSWSSGFQA